MRRTFREWSAIKCSDGRCNYQDASGDIVDKGGGARARHTCNDIKVITPTPRDNYMLPGCTRDARDDFHALAIFAHLPRASVRELITLYDAQKYREHGILVKIAAYARMA